MFEKSALTLFVTVALALSTSAYPSLLPRGTGNFHTISISKRGSLKHLDGTFNVDRAVLSVAKVHNKHIRNLRNFHHNARSVSDGAALRRLPISNPSSGSESLTDQMQGLEWTGPVTIGTNKQSFTIDFDTGSADLWIPSEDCTSSSCQHKRKYDPKESTMSKSLPGKFSIQYGDNSTVSGKVYSDTVSIAGIEVKGQHLAAANVLSPMFAQTPEDGILGMAFSSISQLNSSTFFENAISSDAVSPVFAFYLAGENSELHLGGTNQNHFKGDIEFHTVVNTENAARPLFWQLGNCEVVVNGKVVASGAQTIIDSGTTLTIGPPNAVEELYAKIPGSQKVEGQDGLYAFPCNKVPKVGFQWGGKLWEISADKFNAGQISSGSSMCAGTIVGQDLPFGSNVWLLGDTFMQNVYTVFNYKTPSVGFAQLR